MSAYEQLRIATRRGTDRLIFELDGELDMVTSPRLQDAVSGADLEGANAVVIDLRGVSFMDSTGLKAIFAARTAVQEQGRQFAITPGSPQVQRLLTLTGLDEHLHTIDTPDAATT
ncbi:MAG TPA: STAS domain-containing protein [Solirubrobacteraceae bacterium]|jgi:anti-sigma B factor antagonist|nr:STAS domain-containing protein [Solirubrobacteraceae bacterium]